jgi:hypothetical protein
MTVDDTVASLGKLLDERCGVDVITRSSSPVVAESDDDAIALLPLSLLRTGRTASRRPASSTE